MSRKKETVDEKTFGGRLATAMGDISVYKLSQMTGFSHTILHKYLNNSSEPSIPKTKVIATKLNVSFLWLAIGEGSMKAESRSNPDILAPENLRKISVDLETVLSVVESLSQEAKNESSPEALAQDVVLRCLKVPDR